MAISSKVVLITGGTGFLGQEVVKHFVAEGARVFVTWVAEKEVERIKTFLGSDVEKITLLQADVTNETDVFNVVSELEKHTERLDALLNLVGGFTYGSIDEASVSDLDQMLKMNATSCFVCCKTAKRLLAKAGSSSIVNVAAMPALKGGAANMAAYSASKAAVLNLTQSLAEELKPNGIRVNAILPSIIDTPANRSAMPDADTSSWLPPAEMAKVIAFLVSDDARIVTGSALTLSL